jgi:hypothetical protein
MPNRASGVLTPADSEFLRTEGDYYTGEYARQSRYDRERAIRSRIVESLLDFPEIRTHLDDDQRRKIFTNPEENGADEETEFDAALVTLIGWLYLGCREAGRDFDAILKTGIGRAEEERHDGPVDSTVTFEIEATPRHVSAESLAHDLEAGNQVYARNIYDIPKLEDVPIDSEAVDIVRFAPEDFTRSESEKEVVETILRTHLGIEADVEIAGFASMVKDVEEQDGGEE